ncbi:MAG: methyltransferase domain-containing protein [Ignavibacteriaceae bacterium]|jgi:trans-aconitate methyltransferase
MGKINFSNIAKKYHEISTVQKSASENLFNLLDIKPEESVLDVGCGTGNLTSKIKAITSGRVIGIDASEGMVEEAVKNYRNIGIEFLAKNIQDISFDEEFDVIFCNSTFQWFKNIGFTLKKLCKALKPGGRIAIQAPATESYCPNFLSAVNGIVTDDEEIGEVFSFFKSPWLFFETAEEYTKIFEEGGFKVTLSGIESQSAMYTPEKVFEIFSSGAIAGYLNQDNYSIKIDNDYIERFKNLVNGEIAKQADKNGLVNLIFKRIYLLAFKL